MSYLTDAPFLTGNVTLVNGALVLSTASGIVLPTGAPGTTANTLYQLSGSLYFNGVQLSTVAGSGFTRIAVADANYTISVTNSLILAYSSITAARTLTLPAATTAGQLIWVISESGTIASNAIALTIARAGTDTIEGNTSYTLLGQYNSVCLSSNGAGAWSVLTYKYPSVVVSDAAYTILIREDLQVIYSTLTAARIITLPSANTAGQQIIVMDASGSCSNTLTLTVTRAGSDTINGLTTFVLNGPYSCLILTSNGSGKWIASTVNNGTNPAIVHTTASAVPFLTATRTDLSASVTFTQTVANEVNCSGIFGTPQISITGPGAANVPGSLYYNSGYGLTFQGKTGTSYDFAIANPSQTVVLGLTTATNNFVFTGGASFAATITSSANIVLTALTAGTSAKYIELSNTGNAGFYFGVESSVAGSGFTGSNAYESVLYSANNLFVNTSLLRCGGAISALSATFKPTSGPAALHVTDSTGTSGRAVFLDGGLAATYNWVVAANYNITNVFEITASTTLGGSSYITPCFKLDAFGNGTLAGSLTSAGATISQTATVSGSSVNGTGAVKSVNSSSGAFIDIFAEGSNGDGITSWVNSGVLEGVPGSGGNTVISAYTGSLVFQTNLRTVQALILASNGAATFATGAIFNATNGSNQITLQGSSLGSQSQTATIAFSDAGQNSLDIRTHYPSATNVITLSPGNTTVFTLTNALATITAQTTINSSGNILTLNNPGGSSTTGLNFSEAGVPKFTVGTNLLISGAAALEFYDSANGYNLMSIAVSTGNTIIKGSVTASTVSDSSGIIHAIGGSALSVNLAVGSGTGTRAMSATYTNSTNRILIVYITAVSNNGAPVVSTINSSIVGTFYNSGSSTTVSSSISLLVPPGATYGFQGGGSITTWFEY